MTKRKALTIYLDPEDHAYLSHLAAAQGTSMSGALRQLLRDLRRVESGVDEVTIPHQHIAETVVAESSPPYSTPGVLHDETSMHGKHPLTDSETSLGQSLLQRVISDMAKDREPSNSISLGEMLDQSRERWAIATDADANLLEALMADRSEDEL